MSNRLSRLVAERLGIVPEALQQMMAIPESELLHNLELDRALAHKLAAEGVA